MSSSTFGAWIEHSLNQGLVYTFAIDANLTRPGDRKIKLFDRFRFRVVAHNKSEIPVRDLRGAIDRTDLTDFTPVPFVVERLEPGGSELLAVIETSIVRRPGATFVFDQVGVVSATAFADLSFVAYQEWDKPLVPESAAGGARGRGPRADAGTDPDDLWGQTLPLARRARR